MLQTHNEVAAREGDDDVAFRVRRSGDCDGARAGGARLPHATLPHTRGDVARRVDARDLDICPHREARVGL